MYSCVCACTCVTACMPLSIGNRYGNAGKNVDKNAVACMHIFLTRMVAACALTVRA